MSDHIIGLGDIDSTPMSTSLSDKVIEAMTAMDFTHIHCETTENWTDLSFMMDGNGYIDYSQLKGIEKMLLEGGMDFSINVNEYVEIDIEGYYYDSGDENDETV